MKKGVRLWVLLTVTFVTTLCLLLSLFYGILTLQTADHVKEKEGQQLLRVGRQLALEPTIQQAVAADEASTALQARSLEIADIYGFDFIVFLDMAGIRLTHPDPAKIGGHFAGNDESPALAGEEHLSVSHGTLGESLRGFVPIYYQQQQVGVVALGLKVTSLSTLAARSKESYTLALVISLVVGLAVSLLVAYYLKRQLHNLEPREIAQLYEERNAMLDESKDVIVVTNLEQQILLANHAAEALYQQMTGEMSLIGKPLTALLQKPFRKQKTEQLYQQNGQDFLLSIAPIRVNQRPKGSIFFLRDATETFLITDQLRNTTAYASALQSQSHEFMNRLHVIYGLVDLEAYDELQIYLRDWLEPEEAFAQQIAFLVKDPLLASFLLGERQKFAENKTPLLLTLDSIPLLPAACMTKWLTLLRYLHRFLLQNGQGEVQLQIHYGASLTFHYATAALTDQWQATAFFEELLAETHSTFEEDYSETAVNFYLTFSLGDDYHEDLDR